MWQAEERETYRPTQTSPCHCPERPSLRRASVGMGGGGCWNSGFRGQTRGEGGCWLRRDSLKECGTAATRSVHVRSTGLPQKQSAIVKWRAKRGVGLPLQPLSLCAGSRLRGLRGSAPQPPPQLAPRHALPRCLSRPWEQTPAGCPHADVKLKLELSHAT